MEKAAYSLKEKKMRDALGKVIRTAPPKLGALALWCLENLDQVAFHSIRGLAKLAEVDPNLVPRLARELGYDGFEPMRAAVQRIIQNRGHSYGDRARALRQTKAPDLFAGMITAGRANFDTVMSPASLDAIGSCITPLLEARRIHAIGVRSCYSIAHYFSYVGTLAFDNFVPVPSVPGAILDQMAEVGPEDIVVAITYEHYSTEVVSACQIAQERGARILALTDAQTSPIARGAWRVVILPMAGPQLMPSLASAFMTVEMILAGMAAGSDKAAERIAGFEERLASLGGYLT